MEQSKGAGIILLHVYYSLLYKVWENTASNWGFDKRGQGDGKGNN